MSCIFILGSIEENFQILQCGSSLNLHSKSLFLFHAVPKSTLFDTHTDHGQIHGFFLSKHLEIGFDMYHNEQGGFGLFLAVISSFISKKGVHNYGVPELWIHTRQQQRPE